ncbi:MAG: rhomboid family intramembrane serine protease [Pararhodobacter sp.]|nr:rhomboid family intramembrane serine protease [Pararhodobacter sp.]
MTQRSPLSPDRPAPVVLAIVAICTVPELLFLLAETPFLGQGGLRRTALIHGAFWPRLLIDWQPVWPGQPMAMFVTYAFLHGGVMHLLFNMLVLVHLGREAVPRLGQRGFLLAYVITAAGGAAAFWLISDAVGPMVGASGAVFGLFGMTQYWDWQRRRARNESLRPFWNLMAGLILMNVALYFLAGGFLAWQAHLGGYVAGFLFARIVTPTLHHRWRDFG